MRHGTRSEIERVAKVARVLTALAHERDFDEDLGGTCMFGAFYLRQLLLERDIRADFVAGTFNSNGDEEARWRDAHCWVRTARHIVDVTATQFNTARMKFPDVFVTSPQSTLYKPENVGNKALVDVRRNWVHEGFEKYLTIRTYRSLYRKYKSDLPLEGV